MSVFSTYAIAPRVELSRSAERAKYDASSGASRRPSPHSILVALWCSWSLLPIPLQFASSARVGPTACGKKRGIRCRGGSFSPVGRREERESVLLQSKGDETSTATPSTSTKARLIVPEHEHVGRSPRQQEQKNEGGQEQPPWVSETLFLADKQHERWVWRVIETGFNTEDFAAEDPSRWSFNWEFTRLARDEVMLSRSDDDRESGATSAPPRSTRLTAQAPDRGRSSSASAPQHLLLPARAVGNHDRWAADYRTRDPPPLLVYDAERTEVIGGWPYSSAPPLPHLRLSRQQLRELLPPHVRDELWHRFVRRTVRTDFADQQAIQKRVEQILGDRPLGKVALRGVPFPSYLFTCCVGRGRGVGQGVAWEETKVSSPELVDELRAVFAAGSRRSSFLPGRRGPVAREGATPAVRSSTPSKGASDILQAAVRRAAADRSSTGESTRSTTESTEQPEQQGTAAAQPPHHDECQANVFVGPDSRTTNDRSSNGMKLPAEEFIASVFSILNRSREQLGLALLPAANLKPSDVVFVGADLTTVFPEVLLGVSRRVAGESFATAYDRFLLDAREKKGQDCSRANSKQTTPVLRSAAAVRSASCGSEVDPFHFLRGDSSVASTTAAGAGTASASFAGSGLGSSLSFPSGTGLSSTFPSGGQLSALSGGWESSRVGDDLASLAWTAGRVTPACSPALVPQSPSVAGAQPPASAHPAGRTNSKAVVVEDDDDSSLLPPACVLARQNSEESRKSDTGLSITTESTSYASTMAAASSCWASSPFQHQQLTLAPMMTPSSGFNGARGEDPDPELVRELPALSQDEEWDVLEEWSRTKLDQAQKIAETCPGCVALFGEVLATEQQERQSLQAGRGAGDVAVGPPSSATLAAQLPHVENIDLLLEKRSKAPKIIGEGAGCHRERGREEGVAAGAGSLRAASHSRAAGEIAGSGCPPTTSDSSGPFFKNLPILPMKLVNVTASATTTPTATAPDQQSPMAVSVVSTGVGSSCACGAASSEAASPSAGSCGASSVSPTGSLGSGSASPPYRAIMAPVRSPYRGEQVRVPSAPERDRSHTPERSWDPRSKDSWANRVGPVSPIREETASSDKGSPRLQE